MSEEEDFERNGFLSQAVTHSIATVRGESEAWFNLASGVNVALQATAKKAKSTIQGSSLDPKVLATLLLIRSCGGFQGVILMAERGMLTEARMLLRSCVENSFCLAALHDNPTEFVQLLKDDDNASRRSQASFILDKKMFDSKSPDARDKLQKLVDSIPKSRNLPIGKLAAMGAYVRQYLYYKLLSHEASHVSARSLSRHLITGSGAWSGYVWGQAEKPEVDALLDLACIMTLGLGVAFTQIVGDFENNEGFQRLSDQHALLTKS